MISIWHSEVLALPSLALELLFCLWVLIRHLHNIVKLYIANINNVFIIKVIIK